MTLLRRDANAIFDQTFEILGAQRRSRTLLQDIQSRLPKRERELCAIRKEAREIPTLRWMLDSLDWMLEETRSDGYRVSQALERLEAASQEIRALNGHLDQSVVEEFRRNRPKPIDRSIVG